MACAGSSFNKRESMKTNGEARPNKHRKSRGSNPVKLGLKGILLSLVAFVLLPLSVVRAGTVYAVADNGTGVNLFGTIDVATGQFTTISQPTPLFYTITAGPGGILYGADINSGGLFTISASGATDPFGSVTAPAAFHDLVYSESAGDFLAANLDTTSLTLYSIAKDGASDSLVGKIAGYNQGIFPTGGLVYGPGQKLYYNYSTDSVNATASQLYTVDPATGALTAVGSGLGTRILTLFSDGKTLYGIDTFITENLGIYTIDTISGAATRVSTLTGLPSDNSYYLDAAVAVPHPAFFTGEVDLADHVEYLAFPNGNYFGYYAFLTDPNCLYHFDLGYEYVFDAKDGNSGVYFYDFKSHDFFYTSPGLSFPYLYDFGLNSFVYYFQDPNNAGHYNTNGVRYFYVFSTGKIISK